MGEEVLVELLQTLGGGEILKVDTHGAETRCGDENSDGEWRERVSKIIRGLRSAAPLLEVGF